WAWMESDVRSGAGGTQDRAVEDFRYAAGHVRVADRLSAAVHVIAVVRREPQVVRGGRRGAGVVQERARRIARRNDVATAARVRGDVVVVDERIVPHRVFP